MKKLTALLLSLLMTALLLTGCGGAMRENSAVVQSSDMGAYNKGEIAGGGGSSGSGTVSAPGMMAPSEAPRPMPEDGAADSYEMDYEYSADAPAGNISLPIAPQGGDGMAEKIIYSIYADIESVDFDKSVEAVYEMLVKYGAFIENSYVSGRNYAQTYYGHQTYRSARFVLRVPKERLTEATEGLNALGSVTSLQSDAQNITAQFTDSESRLKTYRTEESRLLSMLGKADTVADMITIEARLSEVRYQIESLTSMLKNWQNQVDYSTMSLYINEVEKLSEITTVQRSYWTQLSDGVKSTLKAIGAFFMGLFKWLVVNSPVLVILAVIIVPVTILVRKKLRRERKETPPEDKD